MFDIFVYTNRRGDNIIEKYLKGQSDTVEAIIIEAIEALAEEMPTPVTINTKNLSTGLWELKISDDRNNSHRVLYAVKGKSLYILHVFMKKTRKTPASDLKLARKRLKEVVQ